MRACASTNSHEIHSRSKKIEYSCEDALHALNKVGFDAADLCFCSFARGEYPLTQPDWRNWCESIQKTAESLGIATDQAHAPFYALLPDGSETMHDREMMQRSIEAAHICGVKWMVFHPFQMEENGWYSHEKSLQCNLRLFREYADICRPYGVHIAIENMVGNKNRGRRYCSGEEELIELVDTLNDPIFGICWDFGHANLNGIDQPAALRKIGNRLHAVHVNDNKGEFDDHFAPFMGTVPWLEVMKAIKEIGYKGDWTYEIFGFHTGLPDEMQYDALEYSLRLNRYMISLAE